MVGRLTSVILAQSAATASGLALGTRSGAGPGQIGICTWPGEGSHTAACAGAPASIRTARNQVRRCSIASSEWLGGWRGGALTTKDNRSEEPLGGFGAGGLLLRDHPQRQHPVRPQQQPEPVGDDLRRSPVG